MPWQCLWCAGWLVLASGVSVCAATYEIAQRNPQASDDGDGTRERPWKTITRAAEKAGPGDTVVVRDGIYREHVTAKTSGTAQALIQFKAAPGAHVVLTGADRLTSWQKAEGGLPIYRVPWTHRFIGWSGHMTHPDDDYHRLIGRCEQVAIDGYGSGQICIPDFQFKKEDGTSGPVKAVFTASIGAVDARAASTSRNYMPTFGATSALLYTAEDLALQCMREPKQMSRTQTLVSKLGICSP